MLVRQFYQSPSAYCGTAGNPPVNAGGADAPDITGTAEVGEILTCDPDVWTGDPTIVYSYHWFRQIADPPVNTDLPEITGVTTVASILHCSFGTWTGGEPIIYTYRWKREPDSLIPDATLADYTLTIDDLGLMIFCTVTATNDSGETTADAPSRGPIDFSVSDEVLTDEFGVALTDELGGDLTTSDPTRMVKRAIPPRVRRVRKKGKRR